MCFSRIGFPELRCRTEAAAPVAAGVDGGAPAPAPESHKPRRRTEQMVEITNDEGLTEFVKGSLYTLLAIASLDGTQFYKVANDNGEERYIRASRAELVDVYDEPPKAVAE